MAAVEGAGACYYKHPDRVLHRRIANVRWTQASKRQLYSAKGLSLTWAGHRQNTVWKKAKGL